MQPLQVLEKEWDEKAVLVGKFGDALIHKFVQSSSQLDDMLDEIWTARDQRAACKWFQSKLMGLRNLKDDYSPAFLRLVDEEYTAKRQRTLLIPQFGQEYCG